MKRRTYLALSSATLFGIAVAGCTEGDNDLDDGFDDQDSDLPADDTPTPDDESADTADDTDPPTNGDDDDGEVNSFGDMVQFANSYVFEAEFVDEESGDEFRSRGRYHDGNMYWELDHPEGGRQEFYIIDTNTYIVDGDECYILPEPEERERDELSLDTHETELEAHADVEPIGRDTIDGEDVYVFEFSPEAIDTEGESVTYYVSVNTGYIRRVEFEGGAIDFHSWGEADPVEPPDLECITIDDDPSSY